MMFVASTVRAARVGVLPRPLSQLRPLSAHSTSNLPPRRCAQQRTRSYAPRSVSVSSSFPSFSSSSSVTEQEHKAQLLMRRLQSKMAQKKKLQHQHEGSKAASAASSRLSAQENDTPAAAAAAAAAAAGGDHAESVEAARAAIAEAIDGGHGRAVAAAQGFGAEGGDDDDDDESETPSAAEQMWMEEFEGVVLRTHANMSVEVAGLTQAKQNSFVRFDDGSCGIVVRINTTSVTVALLEAGFNMGHRAQGRRLGNFGAAHSDDAEGVVKATSVKPFRFPFSSELLGRVWSPVGSPVIFDGDAGTAVHRKNVEEEEQEDGSDGDDDDASKSLQHAREAVWMMRKADVTIPAVFPNTTLRGRKSSFLDAAKVRDQVLTGMPLIDSLYPIGYGSRVSVQASSGAGALESSIATNVVAQFCSVKQQQQQQKAGQEKSAAGSSEDDDDDGHNSKSQGAAGSGWAEDFPENVCVYVCVGKSQAQHREILRALKATGALDSTIVIAANPNQLIDFGSGAGSSGGNHSTLEYLAPFIGNSLAMQLRDQGHRVLAVYDDLSNHVRATLDFAQIIGRSGTIVPQVEQASGSQQILTHKAISQAADQASVDTRLVVDDRMVAARQYPPLQMSLSAMYAGAPFQNIATQELAQELRHVLVSANESAAAATAMMDFGIDPNDEGENMRVVDLVFRQAIQFFLTEPMPRGGSRLTRLEGMRPAVEPGHSLMLQFAAARGHLRRVIEALVEAQGSSMVDSGGDGASGLGRNQVLNLYGKTLWRCVVNDPDPNTLRWVNMLAGMPPAGTAAEAALAVAKLKAHSKRGVDVSAPPPSPAAGGGGDGGGVIGNGQSELQARDSSRRGVRGERTGRMRLPAEMWVPLERSARSATDLFLSPEILESILSRV